MALAVIGSGFGRTGTMSLKLALEQLGFGPCHHMEEVVAHPEQLPHWCAAVNGETVNWEDLLAGYRSVVDWPGANFWRELAEAYPAAKVIHTTRPRDAWWKSYSATIAKILGSAGRSAAAGGDESIPAMAYTIVATQTFKSTIDDKVAALAAFDQRQRDVVTAVPAARRLVFDVRSGWQPLCKFLDVDVPDAPFPRSNNTAEFWETFGSPPKPDDR